MFETMQYMYIYYKTALEWTFWSTLTNHNQSINVYIYPIKLFLKDFWSFLKWYFFTSQYAIFTKTDKFDMSYVRLK